MIETLLKQNSIFLTQEQIAKLEEYRSLLIEWNEKFNLTTVTEKDEVWLKHFIDSLCGAYALQGNANVCDVGSGGGLPAIPLLIYRNDVKFTLVDSRGKKVEFLNFVIDRLKLNATARNCRIEEIAEREFFDVVTARAVAPLPILLEYTAPLVKVNGKIVAYKTPNEDVTIANNAMKLLSLNLIEQKDFTLSNGDSRRILIFNKNKTTDKLYPRPQNKPRKFPL